MKAVSGSLGGIVEACCLQPIDVIKTRLQLDRTGTYRGIVHCGTTVSSTEGVRALWKGLTPFATHLTLKYTLRMGSNAVFLSVFKDSQTGKISNHGRLLSGFGAGILEALTIVTPFEVCFLSFFRLIDENVDFIGEKSVFYSLWLTLFVLIWEFRVVYRKYLCCCMNTFFIYCLVLSNIQNY